VHTLDEVKSTSATSYLNVKPQDPVFRGNGWRDFVFYRDLGIAAVSGGTVIAPLVIAHSAPEITIGGHLRKADFHSLIMLRGLTRFEYEDMEILVNAGDCVNPRPGMHHYLFDCSPDMERLQAAGPADFSTADVEPMCEAPMCKGWSV